MGTPILVLGAGMVGTCSAVQVPTSSNAASTWRWWTAARPDRKPPSATPG